LENFQMRKDRQTGDSAIKLDSPPDQEATEGRS